MVNEELVTVMEKDLDFGDLIEIALKEDRQYSATHEKGRVQIHETRDTQDDEFGIISICGYYGGFNKAKFREGISGSGAGLFAGEYPIMLCLNPTIHKPESIRRLHYTGEGQIKIPISALASYRLLNSERRGLRVVN